VQYNSGRNCCRSCCPDTFRPKTAPKVAVFCHPFTGTPVALRSDGELGPPDLVNPYRREPARDKTLNAKEHAISLSRLVTVQNWHRKTFPSLSQYYYGKDSRMLPLFLCALSPIAAQMMPCSCKRRFTLLMQPALFSELRL
jgi:hypothetical protein